MRTAVCLAVVATVVGASLPISAQETSVEDREVQQMQSQVEEFFRLLAQQQLSQAYERLLNNNPTLLQGAQEMIRRTGQLRQHGPLVQYHRIWARQVGPHVLVFCYLAEHRRLPVVWYVTFYRVPQTDSTQDDNWMVIRVRFDTDIERVALALGSS